MLKVQTAQAFFVSSPPSNNIFFIMSTGNMLLGQARGSVGDLTFYRRSGKQVTRAKATQVSNPKSTAQMIQRMIFATAAAAYSRLRTICDHSFENVQYGAKSQARFMSLNLERLRAFYPTSISTTPQPVVSQIAYAAKGDAAYSGQGLIISRGSLPEVPVRNDEGQFSGFGTGVLSSTSKIIDVLNALNAEPGDQITIVAMQDFGVGGVFAPRIYKSRYVVDANATSEQLNATWDKTGAAAAFDAAKTQIGLAVLELPSGAEHLMPAVNDETPVAAAVIISRQETNGKWLRSNAVLVNTTDEGAWYSASYALPTWEYAGTDIETENERYLNNADI